jgi:CubicO group peptidase (beta-lactamase class C family)
MKRQLINLLLLALISATACSTEAAALSAKAKTAIRAELKALVDEGHYPGASILLIHEGKVVMREALGVVDLGSKKPFTVDQLCWLASTGKMFTATLMALLVDEGILSFDEPIAETFPEFGAIRLRDGSRPEQPIRLRHALSHTSGVPGNGWMKQNSLLETDPAHAGYYFPKNPQEFIDGCLKLGLAVQPGTQLLYGRPIDLSACVVEKKTGKTFIELMETRVFRPLGLKQSTIRPTKSDLQRLAPLYSSTKPHVFEPDTFGLEVAERQNTRLSAAGGAVYTTLDELGVLMQLHLNRGRHQGRQLVRAATLAKLYRPQPGTKDRYGLAFQIMKSNVNGQSTLYNHPGYSGPVAWFDFERQLCGVLLMQSNTVGRGKHHQRVINRIHEFIPAGKR